MELLKIKLFGRFELEYGGLTLFNFGSSKAQELAGYLLLHRNRAFLREALAEWLWGQDPIVQGKKSMRQAIWEIQSTLKGRPQTSELQLLQVTLHWIQFNPNLACELDTAEFEKSFNGAQGLSVADLSEQQIERLQNAQALYHGDLLEGWYRDWCAGERERFRDMYVVILEKLMVYSEINHQYEAGLDYGTRILNCDRALESAHQYLMRLYYLSGYRVKALRQFERCQAILREELGVSPSLQTLRLYEQIKADKPEELTPLTRRRSTDLFPATSENGARA